MALRNDAGITASIIKIAAPRWAYKNNCAAVLVQTLSAISQLQSIGGAFIFAHRSVRQVRFALAAAAVPAQASSPFRTRTSVTALCLD
jgi:hypothetical protein